jgi:hypothetical protein
MTELTSAMVAKSTMAAYRKTWEVFAEFFSNASGTLLQLPVSVTHITLFIAFMHGKGYSPSSISSSLSVIAFLHKLYNVPDPSKSFLVIKLLCAARHLRAKPDVRLPITKQILQKLLNAAPFVTSSNYRSVLFRAALVLGFNAFLRIGEMFPLGKSRSANCLHLSDLLVQSDGLILSFRRFKSSGTQGSQTLRLSTKTSCCPLRFMQAFLAERGPAPGQLYRGCFASSIGGKI